jgi:transcriptional regulator with XRE-family HTH domain
MGLNIKKTIRQYDLEVQKVAKRMGITPTGLSQHINGNPSVDVLNRIAIAIGCDVSELFEQSAINTVSCPYCGNRIKIVKE